MPLTIGSNISSLKAQRQLSQGTSELSKTYERLSSGLRINRSADDAAGLSISESLKSDTRVFNQGVRNLNDGISLLTIADGAVESLSNIVVRLKELAEQSANGTYSATQRTALDKEAQGLSKEYTRIVQSTKFNGVNLLDGSLGSGIRLQGGYGVDGSILSGIGGAIGTGTFQAGITYQVGTSPRSVQTGDFNGDGIADLVSADTNAASLSVLLGNGDGTFQTRISYQIGASPNSVQTGDFNGDGVLDLVSGDGAGLSVFLGNGNGTFQTRTSLQVGSTTRAVSTGDFNGDGILDLVSADSSEGKLSVLLGNGNGTFQTRVSYQVGTQPFSVQSGDLNGDGILDLVSADYGANTLSVILGNGDGTFQARTSFSVGANPYSVQVGDFNGDGKSDLVSADYSAGRLSVLLGNGDGTFQARTSYLAGGALFSVQIGDFNGDGIADLVSPDASAGRLGVLLGSGDGTFQSRISYQVGSQPRAVQTGDFNGDGVLDLVSADTISNQLSVLLGNTEDGTSPLLSFDLKTISGARQALPIFEKKIQQLATQRGKIGAFQSRANVAINVLQAASENYATAEGRIRNADIAEESANLVRQNILQKAASGILAQANQQTDIALKLLRTPS